MGYAVYEDQDARDFDVQRWAGYGVPAECDWPDCNKEIDRGKAYKCEDHVIYEEPDDGPDTEHVYEGCGLYFCSKHLYKYEAHAGIKPKPDSAKWVQHMLTDESWQQYRDENPEWVAAEGSKQ